MATSVRRRIDMTADACKFRGQGFSFTATAGGTTAHDFKIVEARLVEAPYTLLQGHEWGDYIQFQVVDVDNILGAGAGYVLDTFASEWYMDHTKCSQTRPDVWYSAEIPAGLYIRINYTSVGASNVDVKCNFQNHKYTI